MLFSFFWIDGEDVGSFRFVSGYSFLELNVFMGLRWLRIDDELEEIDEDVDEHDELIAVSYFIDLFVVLSNKLLLKNSDSVGAFVKS